MQQVKHKNTHLGLIIVVGLLAILMLILIAALVMFVVTTQFNSANPAVIKSLVGKRPLAVLNVTEVDPALALASLGGVAEADVVLEAINKARPETALSSLLLNPDLSDRESAGDFLALGTAYRTKGDPGKARFCYQMAGTIATLSSAIPDTVRADIFLQASEGLIKINESTLAGFYLNQAFVLASKSPFLQALHRRAIFERLQKSYIILDDRELARKSLDLSANPPTLSLRSDEGPILPHSQPIPVPELVQQAEANRWNRAQELAALLVERGGNSPQTAQEALKEALIQEDRLKLPFYEAELAATTQLSKKIDIIMAQIEWLSIKYRVARQAYGLSLVPEWEGQAEQIRADLTKAYEKLFAFYADLIVALPQASQIDKATEEKLRREILAGELGRYPNYPEEQRRRQLLDATNQLILTQPELNVFVGSKTVSNQELYTLVSAK
jgi:hypothetical protein